MIQRAVRRSLVQKLVDIEVLGVLWDTVKLPHMRSSFWDRFKGKLALVRGGNPLNMGEKTVEYFNSVESTHIRVTSDQSVCRRKRSRVWSKTAK